jgi:hypothetical protein
MGAVVAFVCARLDEEDTAAQVLRDEGWGDRPWDVTECSDKASGECPCIVYQGEYKPFTEAQVPHIRYIADAETPEIATWIARYDPASALREIAVRRKIVRRCAARMNEMDVYPNGLVSPRALLARQVLIDLAAFWSEHPDYDREWVT